MAAVIASAVIPTLVANAFFMPKHLRPSEAAVLAPQVALESIGQETRARVGVPEGAGGRRGTSSASVEG